MINRIVLIALIAICWMAASFHADARTLLALSQGAYDSDAQAYFNALTGAGCTAPSVAFKQTISTYVTNQKNAGNWGGQVAQYIFNVADSCTAAVNLAQPSLYKLTWTGSCTFSVANGLNGDASTCNGDTGVAQSSFKRILQSSAHIDVCTGGSSASIVGVTGSSGDLTFSAGTNKTTRVGSTTAITDTGGGGPGCHYGDRVNTTNASTGKNGVVQSNNVANASTAFSASNTKICTAGAGFCSASAKVYFIGFGLSINNETANYNNINTLITSLQGGTPVNPDQCNLPGSDPCLPAYFTGSANGTMNATVNAGSLRVMQHSNPPTSDSITESTYKYFPFTVMASQSMRTSKTSTYDRGSLNHFIWGNRYDNLDLAGRTGPANPLFPAVTVTIPAGTKYTCTDRGNGSSLCHQDVNGVSTFGGSFQCRMIFDTVAKADAATESRVSWSLGYNAVDSGNGWQDIANGAGIDNAHILYYDSTDGSPNLVDQANSICTDIYLFGNQTFAVLSNYVVLTQDKLANALMPKDGVSIDWEVLDGHTCAQTTTAMTEIGSLAHGKSLKFTLYTNPLDGPLRPYNGYCTKTEVGANVDTISAQADYWDLMVFEGNATGTPVQSLNAQLADFTSPTASRFQILAIVPQLSVADSQSLASTGLSLGLAGVDINLLPAVPGGQCSRPTNEKIALFVGLVQAC